MRSQGNGRKRDAVGSPVAAPFFPWLIMRSRCLLLYQKLFCTECPNLPAIHPGSLLSLLSSGRTRERQEGPVPVRLTLQTMTRCPTRSWNRNPRAVNETTPLQPMWWLWTMMNHYLAAHIRPRLRNPRHILPHSRTPLTCSALRLKSEGWNCQYSKEMPDLVKYRNKNVLNLWQAPNTDDHSAHLATMKKRSWSYPAKGNLQTVKQFLQDLQGCGDPEKIQHGDKILWDRGMPGIPQDNTPPGTKRECIKARYVMKDY